MTDQQEKSNLLECTVISESDCRTKAQLDLYQHHPPVSDSNDPPGCIVDLQYYPPHMSLCMSKCVEENIYHCNNETKCICKGKGRVWPYLYKYGMKLNMLKT